MQTADALGLNVEDYETDKAEVLVSAEQISKFFKAASLTLNKEFLKTLFIYALAVRLVMYGSSAFGLLVPFSKSYSYFK